MTATYPPSYVTELARFVGGSFDGTERLVTIDVARDAVVFNDEVYVIVDSMLDVGPYFTLLYSRPTYAKTVYVAEHREGVAR